jgi:hypothetical protein
MSIKVDLRAACQLPSTDLNQPGLNSVLQFSLGAIATIHLNEPVAKDVRELQPHLAGSFYKIHAQTRRSRLMLISQIGRMDICCNLRTSTYRL